MAASTRSPLRSAGSAIRPVTNELLMISALQCADNEKVWRLNLEPECRPVAFHVSSCRRSIVGADDQDRLVGPFGE
jgi:hypothetical protein